MLSRCYGLSLVYTECSSICVAAIWCTLHVPKVSFVVRENHFSKRLSNALQLTQNGSSLCYHFSSPLMQNKNELPGRLINQNTQASCSHVAMANIWCTLNAVVFAWLLFGAHSMLRTLNLLSAKTIAEITQQHTAIDPKRIITVLLVSSPLMPNQNDLPGG